MEKGTGWREASPEEKKAYIELLVWIVTADGKFPLEQRQLVVQLLDRLEIPLGEEKRVLKEFFSMPSEDGIKNSIKKLKESSLRFSALADVITLALADDQVTEEEKKVIKKLASEMNITEKQFQSIYLTIVEAKRIMKEKINGERKEHLLKNLNNPLFAIGIPVLLSIIANSALGGSAFLLWLGVETVSVLKKLFR